MIVGQSCRFFLLAASLGGWLGMARAQDPLDPPSVALLGAQRVISLGHPAPALIQLPQRWLKQFKEIAARSNEVKLEVGACLAWQEAVDRRPCETDELASWLSSRSPDGVAASDPIDSNRLCQRQAWTVGPMQLGHPLSIDLEHASCDGVTVGDVHAHPRLSNAFFTYYLPSDTDVIRRKLSSPGWLSAVVNDEGVCIVINGQESVSSTASTVSSRSQRLYGELFAALLSGTAAEPAPDVDLDRFETSWVGQAYADRVGRVVAGSGGGHGALYCGRFGEPLRRHLESEEAAVARQSSPVAQVAAKAAIVVARWLYHPDWLPIDFAWSDREDPAFRRYLASLMKAGGSAMPACGLDASQAAQLQRAPATVLLQRLWPLLKDPTTGRPPALSFWNFRAPRESRSTPVAPNRVVFFVARAPSGWTYQIDSAEEGSSQWRTIAQAWPGRGKYFLVQREGERYRLHEENATYTYDGDAVAAGSNWERTGQGVLVVGSTRYEGAFERGQMHGRGTMESAAYRYEGIFEHNRPVGPGRLFVKETQSWHDLPYKQLAPLGPIADVR